MFVRRPGGQAQFSAQLARPARPASAPIAELQRWLPDHLDEDLSVEVLAASAAMSPRSFARRFRAETGTTPAAFVEALRVEAARRLLETSVGAVATVAAADRLRRHAETLHRAFARRVGTTPDRYRQHFHRTGRSLTMQTRHRPLRRLHRPRRHRARTRCSPTSRAPTSCSARDRTGPVHDDNDHLRVQVDATFDDVPAPDILLVARRDDHPPAGRGRRPDRRLDRGGPPDDDAGPRRCAPARCCSARPGCSTGEPATTHWCAYDAAGRLRRGESPSSASCGPGRSSPLPACPPASTWRSPSSACMDGTDLAEAIQLGIEYDPQPPYDAGAPSKARPEIKGLVEAVVGQAEAAI